MPSLCSAVFGGSGAATKLFVIVGAKGMGELLLRLALGSVFTAGMISET